ncbi:MAG: hypothetical protein JSW73_03055 [Candidatus Woesearchaeota archaeon]|nr:MAG: hypothetical protein JSW73_03055 [Candidatus Woesearchaeota archaeon]
MIKKVYKYALFFLAFFLVLPLANAVLISGSKLLYTEYFVPGKTFTYTFYATPSVDGQKLAMTAPGPFQEYFIISPETIVATTGDFAKFTAIITLPLEAPEPGKHRNKICVGEADTGGDGMIVVKAKSCGAVVFISLYDGKYIKSRLLPTNSNAGDLVPINLQISNWGKEDISELKADLVISENDKVLATLNTDTVSLASTETKDLKTKWNSEGVKEGKYNINATIYYDGNIKRQNTTFRLGHLNVFIEDYTKKVIIGEINKFDIDILSGWNLDIPSVYGEVKVFKDKELVTSFKTTPEYLKPWRKATLLGYLDGTKLESIGEYDVTIKLFYMNSTTTEPGKITVIEPELEEKPESKVDASVILLVVISIALIIIFTILYRIKNRRYKTWKRRRY